MAASVPRAKSRESPGRNGVTTRPVSQKMMRKKIEVAPQAVVFDDVIEVLIEVQEKINQPKAQFK